MNSTERNARANRVVWNSVFIVGMTVASLVFVSCSGQKLSSDEFTRLMNTGKSYYEGGESEKSITAFRKAVTLNPTHLDAHLNLANACLLANQSTNAIREAQEALDLDSNSGAAYYIRGCAYLRLNQFEDAIKALQQVKNIDKTVNAVSFQLGRAHQGAGHLEDAIREFQEVVEFEPEHPAAHYSLSQALIRAGKKEEANQELEKHRQVNAKKPGTLADEATYERCDYTKARAPFALEEPAKAGVKVTFADATETAFGNSARNYRGPVGVIDINLRGQNDLFVCEGNDGFRLLLNSNGVFRSQGEHVPGIAGAKYNRCLVGDLNNDRFDDVVMLSENGIHLFKFATNGAITEVTSFAGLKNLTALDGAMVDLDFTGKLDLLISSPDQKGVHVLRNLGNMYFKDVTQTSGVPAVLSGVRQLVVDDWNNDDLMDVFIVRDGQTPLLLTKQRGGPLVSTNSPGNWPVGKRLAVGDLNNDLRNDLVAVTGDRLECIFGGVPNRPSIPLGNFAPSLLALVDYDNDGWLDIVAGGEGLRIWRNIGREGFREVTRDLGLDKRVKGRVDSMITADLDQDGDTDLLLSIANQGLQFLRNDGGNANQQLKLRLWGNRSNASGLGIRLEVNAGNWRTSRTVTQLPIEIGLGQHQQVDSLNVHWFDLMVPTVDFKVDSRSNMTIFELVLPTGSCPYLYAWDGNRFRFVTDILGASPLGLRLTDDRFIEADSTEFVWIGNENTFKPRHGQFELQITEELREVLYLDEAKLVAVDHPPDTEVHTTGKLVPGKPWPPKEIIPLKHRYALRRATRLDGADVTTALAENDGIVVSPAKLRVPQLRGLAEPHGVVLDFGGLAVERPLVLALTGWLRFGGGMANVAASHNPDLPFPFPTLEVETDEAAWKVVDVVVGAPAGKTKTILVDLSGKLPPRSHRLRLTTAFEIHLDRIALFEREVAEQAHLHWLSAGKTDLHWRGFSDFADLPWSVPLTPIYGQVRQAPYWRITPSGWCTRYGDVGELIDKRDNALALLNGGDELTLKFDAQRLPVKPAGWVRDFFLFSIGWDKDADFHVERGSSVEPFPFHGMDDQVYGREERPIMDDNGWIKKYNTRWVGPQTLSRAKP
ncbi:MAG: FG-GAP-like repeat-containing protein [Verrucomicrobiota bacterium]